MGIMLELEPTGNGCYYSVIRNIRTALVAVNSAESEEIMCEVMANEMASLLGYERTMIVSFDKKGNGIVRTDISNQEESYQGLHFPATDLPINVRRLYQSHYCRIVVDMAQANVPIVSLKGLVALGKDVDLSESILRGPSNCCAQYHTNMGVRSFIVYPVFMHESLWGIVMGHQMVGPRFIDFETRHAAVILLQAFSAGLEKLRLVKYKRLQDKAKTMQLKVFSNVQRDVTGFVDVLVHGNPNVLDLIHATSAVVVFGDQLLQLGRAPSARTVRLILKRTKGIRHDGIFYTENLLECLRNHSTTSEEGNPPQAADDNEENEEEEEEVSDAEVEEELRSIPVGGMMAICISAARDEFILWFRPPVVKTVTWAGATPANAYVLTDDGGLAPRHSFARWKEEVADSCEQWEEEAIATANSLWLTFNDAVSLAMELRARHEIMELNKKLKATNAALQLLADELSQLIHHVPVPVFALDSDGRITESNPASEQTLGYSRQQAVGKVFAEWLVVDKVHREKVQLALKSAQEGKLPSEFDLRVRNPLLNKEIELVVKAAARLDKGRHGNPAIPPSIVGTAVVCQDITARKEMAEAAAASQAKSFFLAALSHEMRTPLNGVLGMLQLAKEHAKQASSDPELTQYIEKALHSGDHLAALIGNSLDLSLIEAGKLVLKTERFDILSVINSSIFLIRAKAEEKSIAVKTNIGTEFPSAVIGDRDRLCQVLVNLLSNAVKYSDRGEISLSATVPSTDDHDQATLRFEISDQGIGLQGDDLSRLFNLFVRIPNPGGLDPGGTGLGLCICKNLVTFMGGTIGAFSPGLNLGSVFWFTIPVRLASKGSGPGPTSAASPRDHVQGGGPNVENNDVQSVSASASAQPSLAYARHDHEVLGDEQDRRGVKRKHSEQTTVSHSFSAYILVVEDNIFNMEVCRKMLTQAGHKVECAVHGLDAVSKYKKRHDELRNTSSHEPIFDVILMDCEMTVMDGLNATRAIRAMELAEGAHHVPIIALTAHALLEQKEKCLAAGMNDYMTKPIRREALLEMVLKHVTRPASSAFLTDPPIAADATAGQEA
eukprot:CAMPEP_0184648140 /NCGR_PEP_ID=MMETSP0308-20130426/5207_1 /TAXON_ID=38269 /ORGANISM="Gloeochaete witrockiana, Strain SAG 46.84" /LENGTH=1062 /DNA_ID=CAMNT_0027079729 /DNA_START=390 /DNA_END=3578 /DNA_ORIENTATION=-